MSDPITAERRLVLFHAHPDDESIGTGATMARYAAEGAHVTCVTSTLGEEGEILVPALALLGADQADQLGGYRMGELAAAMRALGVSDHRWLGGAGRYRDSGMIGTPANEHPRAFWRLGTDSTAFGEAVRAAVAILREVRPQVVITYDPNGEYGHPDHIMTHRVARAAVEAAADPGYAADAEAWQVQKVYWTGVPLSVLRAGMQALAGTGASFSIGDPEELGIGVPDEEVTTAVDATDHAQAKLDALRSYPTQISVEGPFFALSNMLGREVLATEHYRLVRGTPAGERDADGRETDLFAGL